ncbi:MAG: tRNA (adenosine(37)-N6)-threonylcarbamoyltransferase complex ATPase subunit type 1 TsaE [Proteobacteria bacterium]|nr:tRNA (adenosine(37)-N6)-threonylcarbamoyltransferase complex ATPase subunit type 1 TsaE [Pseudomonadota bacterium]
MREPERVIGALPDEAATRRAAADLARVLQARAPAAFFLTLEGELGAGKTTFVRGLVEGLGIRGPVRSPTYTLLETYEAGSHRLHHLDWYRLADPAELEALAFRELLGPGQWVVVEWPERAPAIAAQADLAISLGYAPAGRALAAVGRTPEGSKVAADWMRKTA